MNIIAVDDEIIALQVLATAIGEAVPDADIDKFSSGEKALDFARENPCEIAFLDIDMGNMSGITLAKKLKQINPTINIIFVTAYKQYAMEALSLYSSGYVMKPPTIEKIDKEIKNLRYPINFKAKSQIWICCFGNFEVFVGAEPVAFRYNKTKELLAYLIDRGGAYCSNGEIIATLWENETNSSKKKSYLRELRMDLLAVFRTYGLEEALLQKRGAMAISPTKIDCDYYLWKQGNSNAINAYRGEYMSQYSWGEITLAGLEFVATKK